MGDQGFAAITGDPVAIASEFHDEIAERASEIEVARRFPDDLARRLAGTGLYQLCTPRESGGCGRSPREYAEVSETLAKADASAGWCAFIGITSSLAIAHSGPAPGSIDVCESRYHLRRRFRADGTRYSIRTKRCGRLPM